jgi:hypothetical protein
MPRGVLPKALHPASGLVRLRDDFGPESDVDILVEFAPSHTPGLFGIARLERELSTLFGGRKIDLRTPEDLSRYFREDVLREAEGQYMEG